MASILQKFKDLYRQKAAQIASGQGINRAAQGLNRVRQVPLREFTPFTSTGKTGRTIQDMTFGVVKRGAQGAARFNPAYSAYRSVTGNPITGREYLKSGADTARLGGALLMSPLQTIASAGIGGGLNVATGGNFKEGVVQGIQAGQQYGGLSRLTSPFVSQGLNKLNISAPLAQRGAGAVAGVVEGIGQDYAAGYKPDAFSIGLDALAGFGGYGNLNTPNGIGKSIDKNAILTNDQAKRVGRLMKEFETSGKLSKDAYDEAFKLLTSETKKITSKKARIELNRADDKTVYSALKNLMTKNQTYVFKDLAMGAVDPTQASKGVDLSNKPQQLNVQKLNLDDQGKEVVRGLESTDTRDVLKNQDIIAKSDEVNPRLKVNNIDQTKNVAAQDLATRRKVVKDTNDYFKMKASGANKTELEAKLLEIAKTSKVSREAGTDIARQLQARTILADEALNPMQRVFKLLDNAGVKQEKYIKDATKVDWNDANSVVEFYRKHVPPTLTETLDEFRYTNMLSSPNTQIVNAFSNALQTAIVTPVEKTISGALDWAKSSITGSERQYFAKQGIDYSKGYIKAIPDAVDAFRKTLSGKTAITNLDLKGKIPTGTKGFRKAYSTPLRALEASDQFFRTLVKGGEMESLKTAGVTGEKALREAEKSADYRLFRQKFDPTGELGQGRVLQIFDKWNSSINNLRNAPGGKWIVPFLQTPTNILKQGIEYSPLGFSTIPGSKKPIEQLSKALIGSSVFVTAYSLAESGLVTWDVPTNPKDKAEFYAAGLQPYSVKVGDKWISFSKLGPLSYPFAMAASINFAKDNGVSDSEISKTAQGLGGFLSFFADQSYMQGIGDIIDALRGDEFKRDRAISNIPQQLIPYRAFQGWIARMVDPVYRKSTGNNIGETVVNSIKSQTPFVSKSLDYYETPSGTPSMRQLPAINAVSPLKVTKQTSTYQPSSARGIYGELNKLTTKEEKAQKWNELVQTGRITKSNVKDIQNLIRDDSLKITKSETYLRGKGVQNGSRARAIKREFEKAKTKEEKAALWQRYVELGIITKDVSKQLSFLLRQQ